MSVGHMYRAKDQGKRCLGVLRREPIPARPAQPAAAIHGPLKFFLCSGLLAVTARTADCEIRGQLSVEFSPFNSIKDQFWQARSRSKTYGTP